MPGLDPEPPAQRLVLEQAHNGVAERPQVARVIDQDPVLALLDLVGDAPDAAGDDRPALPHRLGNREAESLGEAFLDDHVRPPLQGVDDRGVLLRVLHRNLRDDDPVAGRRGHRLVTAPQVLEDLGLLGIVDDGGRGRAREHEACVRPRRDEADEKSITPTGSLSRSHLETWSTMRASAATGPSPTCAERVTRAAVPSWPHGA